MITPEQGQGLAGAEVKMEGAIGRGKVDSVLVDDATGRPEWARVSMGLLGRKHLVPLSVAFLDDDGVLVVPLTETAVKHAPDVGGDEGGLSADDEDTLYRHYDLEPPQAPDPSSASGAQGIRSEDAPLHRSLDADRRTGAHPSGDDEP